MKRILLSALFASSLVALAMQAPIKMGAQEKVKEEKAEELPVRFTPDGFPLPPGAIHRFGNRQMRHADGILEAVVSPDGKYLATRGRLTTVVWDLKTLNAKHVFREDAYFHAQASNSLAFGEDSRKLIVIRNLYRSTSGRGQSTAIEIAYVFDLESGKKKKYLETW